jgi:hypothetical protein
VQVLHDFTGPPTVAKLENFRVTVLAAQLGQAGVSSACTSSSNWRSHFIQTYS